MDRISRQRIDISFSNVEIVFNYNGRARER